MSLIYIVLFRDRYVNCKNGSIHYESALVSTSFAVRPALKLNLAAFHFLANEFTLRPYNVTVAPGNHMTKTSGEESQTGPDRRDDVCGLYRGYRLLFPEDYNVPEADGISVSHSHRL